MVDVQVENDIAYVTIPGAQKPARFPVSAGSTMDDVKAYFSDPANVVIELGTDDPDLIEAAKTDTPLGQYLRERAAPPTQDRSALGSFGAGLGQGFTFGLSDEMLAAGMAAVEAARGGDFQASYDWYLKENRQALQDAREQHKYATLLGEIGGLIIPGAGVAKSLHGLAKLARAPKVQRMMESPHVLGRLGQGAAIGAAENTLYGIGTREGADQRFNPYRLGLDAGIGAGAGAVGMAAAGGLSKVGQYIRNLAPDRRALDKLGLSENTIEVLRGMHRNSGDVAKAVDELGQKKDVNADWLLDYYGPQGHVIADGILSVASTPGAYRLRKDISDRALGQGRNMQEVFADTLGPPAGQGRPYQFQTRKADKAKIDELFDKARKHTVDWDDPEHPALMHILTSLRDPSLRKAVTQSEQNASIENLINEIRTIRDMEPEEGFALAQELQQRIIPDEETGKITLPAPIDWNNPSWNDVDTVIKQLYDMGENTRAPSPDGKGQITNEGRIYQNMAKELRQTLREVNPYYDEALRFSKTAYDKQNALDLGYKMMNDSWRVDDVGEALNKISEDQIENVKLGISDFFAETNSKVQRTLTDEGLEGQEYAEAVKLYKTFSSKKVRDKMKMVLTEKEVDKLMESVSGAEIGMRLKAAVQTNSKTAIRQQFQKYIDDVANRGLLGKVKTEGPSGIVMRFAEVIDQGRPQDEVDDLIDQLVDILTTDNPKAQQIARTFDKHFKNEAVAKDVGVAATSRLSEYITIPSAVGVAANYTRDRYLDDSEYELVPNTDGIGGSLSMDNEPRFNITVHPTRQGVQ